MPKSVIVDAKAIADQKEIISCKSNLLCINFINLNFKTNGKRQIGYECKRKLL